MLISYLIFLLNLLFPFVLAIDNHERKLEPGDWRERNQFRLKKELPSITDENNVQKSNQRNMQKKVRDNDLSINGVEKSDKKLRVSSNRAYQQVARNGRTPPTKGINTWNKGAAGKVKRIDSISNPDDDGNITALGLEVGNGLSRGWVASCFEKSCKTSWLDSRNHRIEAHGGAIIRTSNGTFYWYGESAKLIDATRGFGYSEGVNCYSSSRIGGPWAFEGLVFATTSIRVKDMSDRDRPYIIERPKVIFNSLTKKYVMWFHLDYASKLEESELTDYNRRKKIGYKYAYRHAAVAVASRPMGPFTFVHSLLPDGEKSLDLQLFQEEGSKSAFLIRSVNNRFVGISRLANDYLTTVGHVTMMVKPALEAMVFFRSPLDSSLYAIASHLTGWDPNPLVLLQATLSTPQGQQVSCREGCSLGDSALQWKALGNPTNEHNSYNLQPTFAIDINDVNGDSYVVLMGDNWLRAGPRGLMDAGYIWLPLEFSADGGIRIEKQYNWSTSTPLQSMGQ